MFQGFKFSALLASLCVCFLVLAFGATLALAGEAPPAIQFAVNVDAGGYSYEVPTFLTTSENGYRVISFGAPQDDPTIVEMVHTELNSDGSILSQSPVFGEGLPTPYGAIPNEGGGFLIFGGVLNESNASVDAYLASVLNDGSIQWLKYYDTGGHDSPLSCQRLQDGFLILGGWYPLGDPNPQPDILLIRTDDVGNQLWIKSYGDGGPQSESPMTATQTPDDGFFIVGSGTTSQPGDTNILLKKVDASGDLIWEKSIGGEYEDSVTAVIACGDGEHLVIAQVGQYLVGYSLDFIRVDADGNELWRRSYPHDGHRTTWRVRSGQRAGDGGYILAGEMSTSNPELEPGAFLMKADRIGEIAWRLMQRAGEQLIFTQVIATPDGGYIATGSIWHEDKTRDLYVLKTNADGKLFVRGDSNGDGQLDISDPIRTLNFLFAGGVTIGCQDAADANDDGGVDISDAVYSLNFLFAGGKDIPPPISKSGMDPTDDALSCGFYYSSS